MHISKKSWRVREAIAVGFFVIFLWLPLFLMNLPRSTETGSSEKRVLASKPELKELSFRAISNYTKRFERYFNDHFGLRNMLVSLNSIIHVKLFGISPIKSVIVGKQGWLFFNDSKDGVGLQDYAGEGSFKTEEVELIRHKIVSLNERLRKKNIHFLLVLVPDKQTVYPEYFPLLVSRKKSTVTRIDQVCEGLKGSGVDLVDLRTKMWSSKGSYQYPLYYRTDTHWNNIGAFLGYEEIIRHVRNYYPQVDRAKLSFFDVLPGNRHYGDLEVMMNMRWPISDTEITLKPKTPPKAMPVPLVYEPNAGWAPVGAQINNKRLPKLVMFGDSFSLNLVPYLSENFSRSVYIWKSDVDFSVIEQEKPDIVIFEIVERYLPLLVKLTAVK